MEGGRREGGCYGLLVVRVYGKLLQLGHVEQDGSLEASREQW